MRKCKCGNDSLFSSELCRDCVNESYEALVEKYPNADEDVLYEAAEREYGTSLIEDILSGKGVIVWNRELTDTVMSTVLEQTKSVAEMEQYITEQLREFEGEDELDESCDEYVRALYFNGEDVPGGMNNNQMFCTAEKGTFQIDL